jgi:uncharacterized delta-60 repeat protein
LFLKPCEKGRRRMKRITLLLAFSIIAVLSTSPCYAQWGITYGGNGSEIVYSIQQTSDKGYIVAGETTSFGSGGFDGWVLKLNPDGSIAWEKTYGGPSEDRLLSVQQTTDGGYIVAGRTNSFGKGGGDFWVLKLYPDGHPNTADRGVVEWQKTYGGSNNEWATFIQQTSDYGYIVAGVTRSFGAGREDMWVLKLYPDGQPNGDYGVVEWQNTYGAFSEDKTSDIYQTPDGGYIMLEDTSSYGGFDFGLLKLNPNGSVAWQKRYDLGGYDRGYCLYPTFDGGCVVVGETRTSAAGLNDLWILKLNLDGSVGWENRYRGASNEWATSVLQTTNGEYIVAGGTASFGAGSTDIYVLKLNPDGHSDGPGSVAWQKTYGGVLDDDEAYFVQETADGSYIVAGRTRSFGSGDRDIFLLKLDSDGEIPGCSVMGSSNFVVSPTNATVHDTYIDPVSSDVSVGNTDVTGQGTTAQTSVICYTNHPPVANPGDNVSISTEEKSTTTIQGTAADQDADDVLEYQWRAGETILLGPTPVGENGACPLDLSTTLVGIGTHTLTLEVSDGQATSRDDMILTIDNSAPHAAASGGGVYEINTDVTLGGNVSDFDGDLLQYAWKEETDTISFGTIQAIAGGTPVSLTPYTTANLGLGMHTIILQVDDGTNEPVTSTIEVEMVDTTVPVLGPVANQTILWPPNHQMVEIIIQANASDNSGGPVTLFAVVGSNEPQDGLGDGDTSPDWIGPIVDQESGTITLQLRAERSGSGSGREYIITITATDEVNNNSSTDVKILVPHDKRKNK